MLPVQQGNTCVSKSKDEQKRFNSHYLSNLLFSCKLFLANPPYLSLQEHLTKEIPSSGVTENK